MSDKRLITEGDPDEPAAVPGEPAFADPACGPCR
jgi:hypothetical protein